MDDATQHRLDLAHRSYDSRIKFQMDEALADLRYWWDLWSEVEQQEFARWVTELDELKQRMPNVAPLVRLKLEFSEYVASDHYRSFSPPIHAIKAAIQAWQKGELYVPNSPAELSE